MTTVLASGVFDVVHAGHIAYLTEARKYGDQLVVALTADRYVNKGPGRPMFTTAQRRDTLEALRLVDQVIIVDGPDAVPVIEYLKPSVYVKGEEYRASDPPGNLAREREAVEKHGGRIEFTATMLGSSSAWIARNVPRTSASEWMQEFKTRHSFDDVALLFEQASKLIVYVYGERILDEYVYVEPLGKSAKETLVTYQPDGTDSWYGGGEVVASHLSAYTKARYQNAAMTPVVKRRYVQKAFTHKVFQTVQQPFVVPTLPSGRPDLYVCADFGHGLFEPQQFVGKGLRWLGLTVQSNSANWGFNPVTRWPSASYVVVDQQEAQLAFQTRAPADKLVHVLRERLGADLACVTKGHAGAVFSDNTTVPAFSDHAVDRIGAGDAFLAWTAPFVYLKAPAEVVGLIGSAAAALHVAKPGNPPLSKPEVLGFIKALMA